MKRFATFETSSHFKFFDDFASKASISFDVVVVVALLLVVVVLRFLLRVFVLLFVFLRAVIKGGTDGDDDFDEQQHVFVERVVAVSQSRHHLIIITAFWKISLSLLVLFTNKKESHAEKEESAFKRERKRKSSVFVSAAAEKCVSRFESVCYYMMRVYKESLSFFERSVSTSFLCVTRFFSRGVFSLESHLSLFFFFRPEKKT